MNNKKIKVKIIANSTFEELEYNINDYLENYVNEKDIIDIKYQVTHDECSAMIIFKEEYL